MASTLWPSRCWARWTQLSETEHGIDLLRHGLGLPPALQALLRRALPPLCARRAGHGGRRGGARFPAHRRPLPRAHDLHRPGRRARCRGQDPQDRPRGAVGRRSLLDAGPRECHRPGDRAAPAAPCRPRRREGGRADHRDLPPTASSANCWSAESTRVRRQRRRLPCRARGRSGAARLHGPAVRAVPVPRHRLRPAGDHAQLARGRIRVSFGTTPIVDRQAAGRTAAPGRATCRVPRSPTTSEPLVGRADFLRHALDGSEVSVEPDGSVYPCCVKTVLPLATCARSR